MPAPIGVFDSGYGGLTILKELKKQLPQYDYIYLGDNARAPYGTRSFETVYEYTLEAVNWFFKQGCSLVIIACNTASAKALRNIQQLDLPHIDPTKRVLGVIRPTTEVLGNYSANQQIGIMGTLGTVQSDSYPLELAKFFPSLKVFQQACPMWVPLIENGEFDKPGADYFVQQYLKELFNQSEGIDAILLACTHYPLLEAKIKSFLPTGVNLVTQGDIVAKSLAKYLENHPEIAQNCSVSGQLSFYTTDNAKVFEKQGSLFFGQKIEAKHTDLA
ncbi:MAG: glutamate racemase [Bacteroidetes bacterium]|jgi:glutamate racemase|nr:glutamate racemase [Bacteroidota bacterium]